jgi:hypothetical protein
VITAKGAVVAWGAVSVVFTFLAVMARRVCDIVLLFYVKKGAFWKYQAFFWKYQGFIPARRYQTASKYVEGAGTRWLEFADRMQRLEYLGFLSCAAAVSFYVFVIVRFHWD